MADPATDGGTTAVASEPTSESPDTVTTEPSQDVGTTVAASTQTSESPAESFFDPAGLSDDLLPAYKQMQAAFTKKTQALKDGRDKVEAYDAFMADPVSNLRRMASQYGISLAEQQQQSADDWQPNTWDEVVSKTKDETRKEVLAELRPLLDEVRGIKRSHVESTLDAEVPEWRQYEDEMVGLMRNHPTLANDPVTLAKLALPSEVLEAKATQRALRKLEQKGKSAEVSGGSTTTKEPQLDPNQKLSFDEAIALARKQLAAKAKAA